MAFLFCIILLNQPHFQAVIMSWKRG